jgi:hypothetical protein
LVQTSSKPIWTGNIYYIIHKIYKLNIINARGSEGDGRRWLALLENDGEIGARVAVA